ncbi:MAG: hypothetical protein KAU21_14840 [Gammaproteobacteria bacterium]|nr:hypothetical protein [Gammaproteobacteria bacterium]
MKRKKKNYNVKANQQLYLKSLIGGSKSPALAGILSYRYRIKSGMTAPVSIEMMVYFYIESSLVMDTRLRGYDACFGFSLIDRLSAVT